MELEDSSKKIGSLGALPSKEDFLEIQSEFKFKQDQTENSENTLNMLKMEFKKREADLIKLEEAETRMNSEIKTLNDKMIKM